MLCSYPHYTYIRESRPALLTDTEWLGMAHGPGELKIRGLKSEQANQGEKLSRSTPGTRMIGLPLCRPFVRRSASRRWSSWLVEALLLRANARGSKVKGLFSKSLREENFDGAVNLWYWVTLTSVLFMHGSTDLWYVLMAYPCDTPCRLSQCPVVQDRTAQDLEKGMKKGLKSQVRIWNSVTIAQHRISSRWVWDGYTLSRSRSSHRNPNSEFSVTPFIGGWNDAGLSSKTKIICHCLVGAFLLHRTMSYLA